MLQRMTVAIAIGVAVSLLIGMAASFALLWSVAMLVSTIVFAGWSVLAWIGRGAFGALVAVGDVAGKVGSGILAAPGKAMRAFASILRNPFRRHRPEPQRIKLLPAGRNF